MAKKLYITAVGTAFWPKIAEKDREYDNYNTGLILDDKGFAAFKKELEAFMEDQKFPKVPKGKKPTVPYQEHLDKDTEERIGWLIRAKSNYQPLIFDAKDKKLYDARDMDESDCPRIGGGTKMRIQVEFNAHEKGVNLYLKKLQIISLKEYGSGFGSYEDKDDGYEAEESEDESFGADAAEEDLDI